MTKRPSKQVSLAFPSPVLLNCYEAVCVSTASGRARTVRGTHLGSAGLLPGTTLSP
jgi:hypothetical protein